MSDIDHAKQILFAADREAGYRRSTGRWADRAVTHIAFALAQVRREGADSVSPPTRVFATPEHKDRIRNALLKMPGVYRDNDGGDFIHGTTVLHVLDTVWDAITEIPPFAKWRPQRDSFLAMDEEERKETFTEVFDREFSLENPKPDADDAPREVRSGDGAPEITKWRAEGAAAFRAGLSINDNPYPVPTGVEDLNGCAVREWGRGWIWEKCGIKATGDPVADTSAVLREIRDLMRTLVTQGEREQFQVVPTPIGVSPPLWPWPTPHPPTTTPTWPGDTWTPLPAETITTCQNNPPARG